VRLLVEASVEANGGSRKSVEDRNPQDGAEKDSQQDSWVEISASEVMCK